MSALGGIADGFGHKADIAAGRSAFGPLLTITERAPELRFLARLGDREASSVVDSRDLLN